jgi:ribosome-binding factor A
MDHRKERVSEAIREEIAELIGYEMSDPRVASVVVTDVQISPNKRRAVVRFEVAPEDDVKAAQAALEHAKSFLRQELAARLDMYRIPDLYFETDSATMLGDRLQHLLKRIRKGRPRDTADEPQKKAVE